VTSRAAAPAPPLPPRIDLVPGLIHVVDVRLDDRYQNALDVLDDAERGRAARFVFEPDRRRFIVSHALLRTVLGRFLNQPPGSLRFTTGFRGKPRLVDPPVDLRFNLSHAGERALIAVALGREVGVDIEQTRAIDALALATRFFAAGETAALRALPESEQPAAFLRCWTRKEAFIKALGDGLHFPLSQFEVSLVPDDGSRQLLQASHGAGDPAARWRIVPLPVDDGYTAALAAESGAWNVVQWVAPEDR
jgi:4'-phosphopantetheinyl transferase